MHVRLAGLGSRELRARHHGIPPEVQRLLPQSATHASHRVRPVIHCMLANLRHRFVPDTVVPIELPPILAAEAIQQHRPHAQRAGQVHRRGIDANDEIERAHRRRRIREAAQQHRPVDHAVHLAQHRAIGGSAAGLQAIETDASDRRRQVPDYGFRQ